MSELIVRELRLRAFDDPLPVAAPGGTRAPLDEARPANAPAIALPPAAHLLQRHSRRRPQLSGHGLD